MKIFGWVLLALPVVCSLATARGLSSEDELVFRLRSTFNRSSSVALLTSHLSTRSLSKKFTCTRRDASRGSKGSAAVDLGFRELPNFAQTYENFASEDFKKFAFGIGVGSKREELVGLKVRNVSTQIHDVLFARLNEKDQNLISAGLILEEARLPKTVELDDENKKLFSKVALDHEESISHLRGLSLAFLHCPFDEMQWAFTGFSGASSFVPVKFIRELKGSLVEINGRAPFEVGGLSFAEGYRVELDYEKREINRGRLLKAGTVRSYALAPGDFAFVDSKIVTATLAEPYLVNKIKLPAGTSFQSHTPGVFSRVKLPQPTELAGRWFQDTVYFNPQGIITAGTLAKPTRIGKIEIIGYAAFNTNGSLARGTLAAAFVDENLSAPIGTTVEVGGDQSVTSISGPGPFQVAKLRFTTKETVYLQPKAHFAPKRTGVVQIAETSPLAPFYVFPKDAEVELSEEWMPLRVKFTGRLLVSDLPIDGTNANLAFAAGFPVDKTETVLLSPFLNKKLELPPGTKVRYASNMRPQALTIPVGAVAKLSGLLVKGGETFTLSSVGLPSKATLAVASDFDSYPLAADSLVTLDDSGRVVEGTLARPHEFQAKVRLHGGSQFAVFLSGHLKAFKTQSPIGVGPLELSQLTLTESGRPKLGVLSQPALINGVVKVEAGAGVDFDESGGVVAMRLPTKKVFVDDVEYEAESIAFGKGKYPSSALKLVATTKFKQVTFEAGTSISFSAEGKILTAACGATPCTVHGVRFSKGASLGLFPETGVPRSGYLAGAQKIGTCEYADATQVKFDATGVVREGTLAQSCRLVVMPSKKEQGEVVARASTVLVLRADGGPERLQLDQIFEEPIPEAKHNGATLGGFSVRWLPVPASVKLTSSQRTIAFTEKGNVWLGFVSATTSKGPLSLRLGSLKLTENDGKTSGEKSKWSSSAFQCAPREGSLLVMRPNVVDYYLAPTRFSYERAVHLASCDPKTITTTKGGEDHLFTKEPLPKGRTLRLNEFFSRAHAHAIYSFNQADSLHGFRVYSGLPLLEKSLGKCASFSSFGDGYAFSAEGREFIHTEKSLSDCRLP